MGIIKCLRCGVSVNDAAEGCPECGADPRTGVVPEAVQRWETTAEVQAAAREASERFCAQAMAPDLPVPEDLLRRYEEAASKLLGLLPDVISTWRMAVGPGLMSHGTPSTVFGAVEDMLAGASGDTSKAATATGLIVGLTGPVVVGGAMAMVGASNAAMRTLLESKTQLAHQARILVELEHCRLGWRLQISDDALDADQMRRLTRLQRDVGPLLTPHGLNATLAWCVVHPGSLWETPAVEGVGDGTVSDSEDPEA